MRKTTKAEKETILLTTEADDTWSIYTFNAALRKKLARFAEQYPELCVLKSIDQESGSATYEIKKPRLSIRLTSPYSESRRKAASQYAKAQRSHAKKKV